MIIVPSNNLMSRYLLCLIYKYVRANADTMIYSSEFTRGEYFWCLHRITNIKQIICECEIAKSFERIVQLSSFFSETRSKHTAVLFGSSKLKRMNALRAYKVRAEYHHQHTMINDIRWMNPCDRHRFNENQVYWSWLPLVFFAASRHNAF